MGEYPSEVQEEEMILVTNKIAKLSLKVSPVKRKRATLKTEAIVTKKDNTDVLSLSLRSCLTGQVMGCPVTTPVSVPHPKLIRVILSSELK